jgi:RNA polymerase sigma-70 factor (ECF subfamily)
MVTVGVNSHRETRDELELVAASANPAEFGVLYDRYVDAVYGYCLFRLWDRAEAEDTTSLVFAKAFEALPRFTSRTGTFRSWLFTIAHNVVVNVHRDRKSHRPLASIYHLPTPAIGPDEEAVREDERARVRAACLQLTEEQRHVIELRMAGLTGAEIATAMGKSLPAIKMLQVRAIDRLQELLWAAEPVGEVR